MGDMVVLPPRDVLGMVVLRLTCHVCGVTWKGIAWRCPVCAAEPEGGMAV